MPAVAPAPDLLPWTGRKYPPPTVRRRGQGFEEASMLFNSDTLVVFFAGGFMLATLALLVLALSRLPRLLH